MKIYSHFGINDFIICCGYKGYIIKEYFANYYLYTSDVTFDMQGNGMKIHQTKAEPWKVTLIDTGRDTATGGRLKRVRKYLGEEDFCFTYGDGLSNVNMNKIINHHKNNNAFATVTAVLPPSKYGVFVFDQDVIKEFQEKPDNGGGWINGGFFVLSPTVIDYIDGDETMWEHAPLRRLVKEGQLSAFFHKGFWFPMDTLRDKNRLEKMWKSNNAPWKVW
jgi:glucose-1-phosphate cytidylyltransferase